MSGKNIADLVIGELSGINWGANNPNIYRTLAMQAVSKGIANYTKNNWSIAAITVGTLTTPAGIVTPYTEKVRVNMLLGQAAILQTMLMSTTMLAPNLIPIFTALMSWLSVPPWTVTITGGTALNPITGVGIATFPSITAMGTACLGEMSVSQPKSMNAAWSIMGKHIYNGLVANVIAPIPTVGSMGPSIYAGVTNCILRF
jgi:hypothetical protein